MYTVYVYVLDTLADWELGLCIAELNSGRFIKPGTPPVLLKTVSYLRQPIITMGGMRIVPDCLIDDIETNETSVLLLPGAETWNDPQHYAVIKKADELLKAGATVCAICGATVALADFGLLDKYQHTSNGSGFLEMVSPDYRGQALYVDEPAVVDRNLITAGSTGALQWARLIIEHLDVFRLETLDYWYEYFRTGAPEFFFALMQSMQSVQSD